MKISRLATNLVASEIVKIGNEVNELKAKGAQIANLTIGDLNADIYPIPSLLKEEIQKAYENNLTNYPPASGLLNLRETISLDLKKRYQLDYSPEEILIAGGSRPLIYTAYMSVVDPGDKVVYPTPSWNNNHYSYLTSAEKVEVETRKENNFLPTAEELKPHLEGAVLLALCSPSNPTGTMFTEQQLREICEVVVAENKKRGENEKPLYLLYDQIYAMLFFGQKHFNPVSLVPEMKNYTIFIDGSSKCFAATGVRVGWGFGPSTIVDKMKTFLTHIGAWAPKPEQEATSKFLSKMDEVDAYVNDFKGKIQLSLNTLHQGIQELKNKGFAVDSVEPMGALYLTIKMDYVGKTTPDGEVLKDTTDVVFYLIREAGMALVPFSTFGNSRETPWFRASVGGCSLEDIKNMLPVLEGALSKLK
ncbi:aminotransferase class I/II-fold pyridoxal phosphate-dependent enzyme [Riemerella anatipestifer]|uniref:pyridoxal phosphate-dependent aminotransferase n=1 Tax=Riemerella anatipestifer TaxID=34085 RepID=UPI000D68A038|nr:aminotransferase class I/II-fold pyridoxal phosphate-dependent enzyme [Riemerella anatipestifer]MDR7693949.1 aminotransferase class I/II-fold pyridoxal phosphate-dependent enzyme [Riemerella anatipestifer]MDR7794070.1 aminotransferase class I/II-fold pyridoxal phosphate-dependent enzyme [Riemerella anatipestifer]MRM85160.1 aminotransferase class I/II-fold pyridoxal phosphate-dependent enzyme [Riemerella anatipestifer]MRM95118.1 aminotransferase class I/II-fold pyridoxal phosphate-dependent e